MTSDLKLRSLLVFVKEDKRICPMPDSWNKLWEMLPERVQLRDGGWNPALPLILAAWWEASPASKKQRFEDHILWAANHQFIDEIDDYLRSLPEKQGDVPLNVENVR